MKHEESERTHFKWEHFYTLILVANALYIILFFLLMQSF